MNQKAVNIMLALAVVAFLLAHIFSGNEPSTETAQVETADQEQELAETEPPVPPPQPPPKAKPPKPQRQKRIKLPAQPKSPPKVAKAKTVKVQTFPKIRRGHVQFEVKNGWAIGFGDILFGRVQGPAGLKSGQTEPDPVQFWPSNKIPYFIRPDVSNPDRVLAAIEYFNTNTVIEFVPYKSGMGDAIVFMKGNEHCYSYLGKIDAHQPIFLSDECSPDNIIHELMHALGFPHEHSRNDRDNYVEILWNNIPEDKKAQFAKLPDQLMEAVKYSNYDYQSIMHYPPTAFAKQKGSVTIKSLRDEIKPRQGGLSPTDIERLDDIYGGG